MIEVKPSCEANDGVVGDDAVEDLLAVADQVDLVHRHHDMADAEQRADAASAARVCTSTPLRASIRMTARSAFEAPVAMLRVYCSWPGVSATMKERRGVVKKR